AATRRCRLSRDGVPERRRDLARRGRGEYGAIGCPDPQGLSNREPVARRSLTEPRARRRQTPSRPRPDAITRLIAMSLIHALGTTVRVDLGEGIDPEEFAGAWSRCLGEDADSEPKNAADDPTRIVAGQRSMTSLTQSITRALIERCAGELLMLHA